MPMWEVERDTVPPPEAGGPAAAQCGQARWHRAWRCSDGSEEKQEQSNSTGARIARQGSQHPQPHPPARPGARSWEGSRVCNKSLVSQEEKS